MTLVYSSLYSDRTGSSSRFLPDEKHKIGPESLAVVSRTPEASTSIWSRARAEEWFQVARCVVESLSCPRFPLAFRVRRCLALAAEPALDSAIMGHFCRADTGYEFGQSSFEVLLGHEHFDLCRCSDLSEIELGRQRMAFGIRRLRVECTCRRMRVSKMRMSTQRHHSRIRASTSSALRVIAFSIASEQSA